MSEAFAVLTGDVVRSSALSPAALDGIMGRLGEAAAEAASWTGADARFTRFRGDGWQCLAPAPQLWLRTALLLRARLRAEGRGVDSRIAVGLGPGELGTGADLAGASGPAFRVAGHLLDRMPRGRRMALGWSEPPACSQALEAVVALADALVRRWTPGGARALAAMLAPAHPPQSELARRLGVSQQMIAKHMQSAGEDALRVALAAVEEHGA